MTKKSLIQGLSIKVFQLDEVAMDEEQEQPEEWTCEATAGTGTDGCGKPVVFLCRKPAKLYPNRRKFRFPNELAFCEEHKHLANEN